MSYNKTLYFILFYFLGGGRRGEGGGEGGGEDMKNENEIKDENENKATYFYVQGARQQRP